jgi:hypothetical protein
MSSYGGQEFNGAARAPSPVAEAPSNLGNCTDLNSLCYNSFSGQGQLLWVGVCLQHDFERFSLVSMVSINLGIRFYGVEKGDSGESIEPEEGQKANRYAGFR